MIKKDKIEETEIPVVAQIQDSQEIEVGSPMDLRPKELPLVVRLPADASKAQIEYAKILNGYAYKNPTKFEEKKDDRMVDGKIIKGFISKLKDLKNAPDPVELEDAPKLKVNKSVV
jgi:hypothetical protein